MFKLDDRPQEAQRNSTGYKGGVYGNVVPGEQVNMRGRGAVQTGTGFAHDGHRSGKALGVCDRRAQQRLGSDTQRAGSWRANCPSFAGSNHSIQLAVAGLSTIFSGDTQ
jgi:hypothetical protein